MDIIALRHMYLHLVQNYDEDDIMPNLLVDIQAVLLGESDHPLRYMCKGDLPITDDQLDDFLLKVPIHIYMNSDNYEFDGNYIITRDIKVFSTHVEGLCCGIHTETVTLSDGNRLLFAFDYGH